MTELDPTGPTYWYKKVMFTMDGFYFRQLPQVPEVFDARHRLLKIDDASPQLGPFLVNGDQFDVPNRFGAFAASPRFNRAVTLNPRLGDVPWITSGKFDSCF